MERIPPINNPMTAKLNPAAPAAAAAVPAAKQPAQPAQPEKPYPPLAGISRAGQENAYAYRPEQPSANSPTPLRNMRVRAEATANVASGDTHYNRALPASAMAAREEDAKAALDSTLKSIMDMVNGTGETGSLGGAKGKRCETCASRVYQDGSNDAGVSFQSPKGLPASTAGVYVASHEGEHVTRETAKAEREGDIITDMKVTLQMGCCPECNRMYVQGGTTSFTKMSGKNEDGAVVTKLADLLGNAGEKFDLTY